jgi:hypothetical protein
MQPGNKATSIFMDYNSIASAMDGASFILHWLSPFGMISNPRGPSDIHEYVYKI